MVELEALDVAALELDDALEVGAEALEVRVARAPPPRRARRARSRGRGRPRDRPGRGASSPSRGARPARGSPRTSPSGGAGRRLRRGLDQRPEIVGGEPLVVDAGEGRQLLGARPPLRRAASGCVRPRPAAPIARSRSSIARAARQGLSGAASTPAKLPAPGSAEPLAGRGPRSPPKSAGCDGRDGTPRPDRPCGPAHGADHRRRRARALHHATGFASRSPGS